MISSGSINTDARKQRKYEKSHQRDDQRTPIPQPASANQQINAEAASTETKTRANPTGEAQKAAE
ncbi:MAG: hypothetical protein CMN95_06055 [Synechococcus sp. MED650]|nr:hypothetical protein [Synechococcus sp. MED650]OUW54634.1 MAG: hypothetical protein CBD48_04675 [Cyanobacteria bacterium TMED188]